MGKYNYIVIDADGHAVEPEEIWDRYMEKRFHDRRPRVIVDNRGVHRYIIEGWLYTTPPGRAVGHPEGFGEKTITKQHGGHDPQARLEAMDSEGIDTAVIFPTVAIAASSGVLRSEDWEYEEALCRAYNNWMADFCKSNPDRLKFTCILPLRNISAAVRELTRAVEKCGSVGIDMPTSFRDMEPGEEYFHPVYEEAQRLGIPVLCHPHAGGQIAYVGRDRFANFFQCHVMSFPFEQMLAMLSIITEGVLEKLPELRFGFLESGIGWVPYWVERMDEHYEKLAHLVPNLTRLPSDWARHPNVIFSCDPDEQMLPAALEFLGEDQVMYASDYPHFDAKTPYSVKILVERADLTDTVKRKILADNAARIFKLKVPWNRP